MLLTNLKKVVAENNRAEHLAIVADEASLTYGELLQKVEVFSEQLQQAEVGPGNVLLAYLENVPAFVVAQLACVKVGCTFAPLDVGLTDDEVQNILDLTQSDLVVCESSMVERCQTFSNNLISVDAAGNVEKQMINQLPAPSLDVDIACMQFSSGSTAASKGVLLNKEAFYYRSYYLQQSLGLGTDDRTICSLPLSHTHGAECLSLPTLLGGGTLYLKSPKFAFPLYILEEIERLKITFFSSIPQFYDFAVKLAATKVLDLSHLRHPFCGSAALAKSTADAFYEQYDVHIKQGYGLAELSVICVNHHNTGKIVYDSIGKPIEGMDWKILTSDDAIDNEGRVGELLVQSKAMFSGYINDEANTHEKLQNGWLHTGDVVSIDVDGFFRIIGRKEDFVKINGFKVYLSEVEKVIIGLDWIKECAVLASKDNAGSEAMVAHIVPKDWALEEDDMKQKLLVYLRDKLSDYKIPKRCVVQKEFPKNALGKILKSKINL